MSCEEYEALIGDAVDGTIDAAAARTLDAHLGVCERCRRVADDLRTIRATALTLERHVPSPEAWTRIAAAVDADSQRQARSALRLASLAQGWPLAAAAAAVLVVGGWWLVSQRTSPLPIARSTPSNVASTQPAALQPVEAHVRAAENEYESAIAGLEAITKADGAELDPDTAKVVRASLTVIDNAIGESRQALRDEPANEAAQQSLFEAFSRKLALLQDTIALINEMRKGNQEGAARIASGITQ